MTTTIRDAVAAFVGVPVRAQTYRNLLYLVLAFPLGLAYFFLLSVGFSLGIGMAITVFGVPILVAMLAVAVVLADLEGELANRLLGTNVRTSSPDTTGSLIESVKRLVTDVQTLLDVVYLVGKFVFGVVSFATLATLLSVSLALVAAPLTYSSAYYVGPYFGTVSVGPFESGRLVVDAFGEAVVVAVVGLVLTLVSLHLLNALAQGAGVATEKLLNWTETDAG